MKAIILAAGRGSRMGAVTADLPKCMAMLKGRPLLDWQLESLRKGGISEIAIVTGYQAQALEKFEGHRFHNAHFAETNMVRSLETAREWLESDPCLVAYSDIVYRPDHVRRLAQSTGDISITVDLDWYELWNARFEDPLSDAETLRVDGQGRLLEIGGRTRESREIEGQYMGLLRFTPKGWSWVVDLLKSLAPSEVDRLDMTALLRRLLVQGRCIQTVPVRGGWCEVDNQHDLELYEHTLATQKAWSHDWR